MPGGGNFFYAWKQVIINDPKVRNFSSAWRLVDQCPWRLWRYACREMDIAVTSISCVWMAAWDWNSQAATLIRESARFVSWVAQVQTSITGWKGHDGLSGGVLVTASNQQRPGSNGPRAYFEAEIFLEAVGLSAQGALILVLFYLSACARSFGGKTSSHKRKSQLLRRRLIF